MRRITYRTLFFRPYMTRRHIVRYLPYASVTIECAQLR